MATLLEVQRALGQVLKDLADVPRVMVVGRVSEGAVPKSPYIVYRLDKIQMDPQDPTVIVDDANTQQVMANATPLEYVVEWVGGDAMGAAFRFSNLIFATQRTADLYAVCGFLDISDLMDLSGLELGTMRARVQARVTLNASLTSTAAAETIEHQGLRVIEQPHSFDKTFTVTQGVNPHGNS